MYELKTTREQSATKQRLLDAAQRLMLAKGFEATTVDDICAAAKLTKGSFFHYFEGKEDLGEALLRRFCAGTAQCQGDLWGTSSDPLARVNSYIDGMCRMARTSMANGCLLGSFAQELCETRPRIRKICAESFDAWAQAFSRELAKVKARYRPKAAFEPKELAEHFIALVEGALILGKTKNKSGNVESSLCHFKHYLSLLLKK